MKLTYILWRTTAVVGFIGIGSLASAQVTMSTTATGGGKTYLSIDNKAVVTNIDTLFAQLNALSSSVGSLTWGDVLDNGATATQDIDFNGYNATGAIRIQGDSLEAFVAIADSLVASAGIRSTGTVTAGGFAGDLTGNVTGDLTGSATVGAGETLDVSAGTLTLVDDQISGDKIDGGRISNLIDLDTDSLHAGWGEFSDSLSVLGNVFFDGYLLVDSMITLAGGTGTKANTVAFGPSAQATAYGAKALGSGSTASYVDAFAAGRSTTASHWAALAFGASSTASGVESVTLGRGATASAWESKAFGYNSTASGPQSLATGEGSTASIYHAWAAGRNSTASGDHAKAFGENSTASGYHSYALGRLNTASGQHSLSLGDQASASGDHARALGNQSNSSGTHSYALGANAVASGGHGYAMGSGSTASGWSSIALGQSSSASGAHALALGDRSTASGYNSAALGSFSRAVGSGAIAGALESPSRSFQEVQFGMYVDTTALGTSNATNFVPQEALFVIGNGTSTSARSNAMVIRKDGTTTFSDSLSVLGNATFAGELSVGDTLRAAAPALFADSVAVGGSLSVAQSIHTQGVTGASGTPLALDSDLGITILAGSFSGPFGAFVAGANGQVGIVATDEIVMDSPRVNIEELLQLTPTASYAATPENGDIWFEEVSPTQANLKIYYNGSWRTILAIP
jgi:hypothetical protein